MFPAAMSRHRTPAESPPKSPWCTGGVLSLALLMGCLLVLLSGCGRTTPYVLADPAELQDRWHRFTTLSTQRLANGGPFSITASMRYQSGASGHRVLLHMWGNQDAALRLDVTAGVGAIVAQIREDEQSFTAFSPHEKKVLVHTGPGTPTLALGVPMPFGVRDLTNLIQGYFTALVPTQYLSTKLEANGLIAYTLPSTKNDDAHSILLLDPLGRPVQWKSARQDGWQISFSRYDNTSEALPGRIDVETSKTQTATVFVKTRQTLTEPYPPAQLMFELPPGTVVSRIYKSRQL